MGLFFGKFVNKWEFSPVFLYITMGIWFNLHFIASKSSGKIVGKMVIQASKKNAQITISTQPNTFFLCSTGLPGE